MIVVSNDILRFNDKEYKCAYGKKGFTTSKKEGDNCTPIGEFGLVKIFYRADKISKPKTSLPIFEINQNNGWCDAPDDENYNRLVNLPYPASHEKLWRDDDLYDLVIVLDYNLNPIIPNKGSAIFMHIAKPEYAGTEGCIALKKEDLLEIFESATAPTKIRIEP